ncbi:MAG: HutD family protein [Bdellovibrionota bacterium]
MPTNFHFKPADYAVQRWKNGRGSTSQLTIEPASASFPLDSYSWRVSSARVNASGPFSLFPGFDRTIILVEGKSLKLDPLGELQPFEVRTFSGEDAVSAEAEGQDLIDYNVFWKRGEVSASTEVVTSSLTNTLASWDKVDRMSVFITAIGGTVEVANGGLSLGELEDWDSLRIDFADPEAREDWILECSVSNPTSRAIVTYFGW